MARKREVVKIDDREFTIKELTLEQIIDISNGSVLFSGMLKGYDNEKQTDGENQPKTIVDELKSAVDDIKRIMEFSCDFTTKDLVSLSPSEIRKLWETFKSVNSDFFFTIDKMGLLEILSGIKDVVLNHYSRALATLWRVDM